MIPIAIDFESFYSNDCSVTWGRRNYFNHPDFEAYMVSIYGPDFAWVGPPKNAPWEKLRGNLLLAHNRSFDEPLLNHLKATGVVPDFTPGGFECTADLSCYMGWGRSLKDASKTALGVELSKDVRDAMKNKSYASLSPDEKMDLAKYALLDARNCYELWKKGGDQWPAHEREISRETTRMCIHGLPVDVDQMDSCIRTLEDKITEALDILPWTEIQAGALSPKEWNLWCRSRNTEPPKSMAKDDPEVLEWMKDHPEEGKILEATHTLRGANSLLKKFKTMRSRVGEDGRLEYDLKYFGASTGRDSGGGGFNVQNMPRGGMYGADLRSCIKAPEGKVLIVADLSQIEARGVAYLARETKLLELARSGVDWYEAMGRTFRLYTGESPMKAHNPKLRHTMKQMCLGCQFKMSAPKFSAITGVPIEDAEGMVALFRRNMPKLVRLWAKLEGDMRRSALSGDKNYEIVLPSGRSLVYNDVRVEGRGGLSAVIFRNGKRMRLKFWAGTLIENATQAFARDVFMDRVLELRRRGHCIVLRVHDEVVIEADMSNVKEAVADIREVMSTPPEWCSSLPLGSDVETMDRYTK